VLGSQGLELLEHNADTILEEIGIDFREDPESLKLWKDAGATSRASGCAFRAACAAASCGARRRRNSPSTRATRAQRGDRRQSHGVRAAYGSPFVRNLDEGRRYARIEDFRNFVKLAYMATSLHHSGGTICEPVDLPVKQAALRHGVQPHEVQRQAVHGLGHPPGSGARHRRDDQDLFGDAYTDPATGKPRTCIISLINANSPLTWDATMLGALKTYARRTRRPSSRRSSSPAPCRP